MISEDCEELKYNPMRKSKSEMQPILEISRGLYEEITFEKEYIPKLKLSQPHFNINYISPETLIDLIIDAKDHLIIDCRFEYEFKGGHITGAINLNSPDLMKEYFFDQDRMTSLMKHKIPLIFHCEFSQARGPDMFGKLRELD